MLVKLILKRILELFEPDDAFFEILRDKKVINAMVKEIANDCGFSDANYMIRLFKRRFGCTPKDFRTNYFA